MWLIGEIIDSTEGDTGIPIGNYLSQYSGNLYLSGFDHWIKEVKRVKHYYRYMDDIVILSDSKEQLHELIRDIKAYAHQELRLNVKENWQIFPTFVRGLDFLGYRFFRGYILLRKTTYQNMRKKLRALRKKVERGRKMNFHEWCSISSYNGWLTHCNSYRLYKAYIYPLEPYAEEYYLSNIRGKNA